LLKLITYYTKPFYRSKNRLIKSAKIFGINNIEVYNDIWLRKQNFYIENLEILSQPRGAGYWLWKPYIILKELNSLNEDDYLIYSDAAIEFVNKIDSLLPYVDSNNGFGIFCTHGYKNIEYTKRDCFVLMNADSEKFWYGQKAAAGFMIFKKNTKTVNFVNSWLNFSKNKYILTDIDNFYSSKNYNEFIDHRHDQSVLSLLVILNDINLLRDSTQYGNPWKDNKFRVDNEFCEVPYSDEPWVNYKYPTILNHHRKKNDLRLIDNIKYFINKILNFETSSIGNNRWFK
jgi:hypothetical protein